MKKILVAILALLITAMVFVSCKTTEKCPAYGETHKFQVEQKY